MHTVNVQFKMLPIQIQLSFKTKEKAHSVFLKIKDALLDAINSGKGYMFVEDDYNRQLSLDMTTIAGLIYIDCEKALRCEGETAILKNEMQEKINREYAARPRLVTP